MSSTGTRAVLDNNYPEKSRGTFSFLFSTRGIFFLSVTYVRLRLLLAFSKNVRKLLSRSGTRALRENNYPNKWRAPFLKRYFFSFFIPSFLPFRSVFSSCRSFSERNAKPKEGRKCERKRGKERRDKRKREAKGKREKYSTEGKARTTEKRNRRTGRKGKNRRTGREGDEREEGKERTRGRNGRGNRERRKGNQGRKEE